MSLNQNPEMTPAMMERLQEMEIKAMELKNKQQSKENNENMENVIYDITNGQKILIHSMIIVEGEEAAELALITIPNDEIDRTHRAIIEFLSQDYKNIRNVCKPFWDLLKSLIENEWDKYTIRPSTACSGFERELIKKNQLVDRVYYIDCWWCDRSK